MKFSYTLYIYIYMNFLYFKEKNWDTKIIQLRRCNYFLDRIHNHKERINNKPVRTATKFKAVRILSILPHFPFIP